MQWMKNNNADIILLQETTSLTNLEITQLQNEWAGTLYENKGTRGARGVVTLIRNNLNIDDCLNKKIGGKGRAIKTTIKLENEKYNIFNIYAPAEGNKKLKQEFFKLIRENLDPQQNNILGGDFNCVKKEQDKSNYTDNDRRLFPSELNMIEREFDMVDIWRHQNPHKVSYTFIHNNGCQSRLDRYMINANKLTRIKNCFIKPCFLSDHEAIIMDLNTEKIKRGKGYWKLNNSLIEKNNIKESIKILWENWKEEKQTIPDIQEWWIKGKYKIKKFLITEGIKEKRREKKLIGDLEDELFALYEKETQIPQKEKKIRELKAKILKIESNISRGNQIRSRAEMLENETGSKFFHISEKMTQERKEIVEIIGSEGHSIKDQKEILKEIEQYYKNLYESEGSNKQCTNELIEMLENKLEDENRKEIGKFINSEEIEKNIHSLSNNKSPGSDGLTVEFYKIFSKMLCEDMAEVFNNAYLKGEIANDITEGIITLIYKKNDPKLLQNWRPISLLNVDYKILSKVLANRLKPLMDKIIKNHQTCGVTGRSLHDNIDTIIKLIEYVNEMESREGCYLICFDLEKAFDRIEHEYMLQVIEQIGLGKHFKRWVQIMYEKATSRVYVNGYMSGNIQIKRSVRQGCPLSMLLFVICSEPFLNLIQSNNQINGYKLPGGTRLKCSAYADDTSYIISSENEIQEIVEGYEKFRKAAGAKINLEKTEILKIGKPKIRLSEKWKKYEKEKIKYLGVWISEGNMTELNTEEVLKKIKKKIGFWKSRKLSLWGRVHVTKAILYNNIWHALQNIKIIPKEIKKIKQEIYSFIWMDRNHDPIERKTVEMPIEEGGLGLFDIESRLISYKIKRIIENYQTRKLSRELYGYYYGMPLNAVLKNYYRISRMHTPKESYENKCIVRTVKELLKTNPKLLDQLTTKEIHKELERNRNHEIKVVRDGEINNEILIKLSRKLKYDKFSSTYKSIEYQLIHNILPTEWYYISKMKLPTKQSPHCENEVRDINHIMWGCKNIIKLRNLIINSINETNVNIEANQIKNIFMNAKIETNAKIRKQLRKYWGWVWENRNYRIREDEELAILDEINKWGL